MRSLDKAITLCEFAISRYPDDHPLKSDHLVRLGMALEEKGLEEEALGAYERAIDGTPGNGMRICCHNIGVLLKARYNRLGEAEDLNKAIWAQEMGIACTAADASGKILDKSYGSLLGLIGSTLESRQGRGSQPNVVLC